MMKRRNFISNIGLGALGLSSVDYLTRRIPLQKNVVVNIYQNKKLTKHLNKQRSEQFNLLDLKLREIEGKDEDIPPLSKETELTREPARRAVDKFDSYFENINFKIKFGDFDIPFDLGDHSKKLLTELEFLKKWSDYDNVDTPKSDDSNIVIIPSKLVQASAGVATTPIIPRFNIQKGHGIVWVNPNNQSQLHRIVAHEIGHTIGLQHFHGKKFGEDIASLMYSSEYAEVAPYNVYGQPLQPVTNKHKFKFNPKISEEDLRI